MPRVSTRKPKAKVADEVAVGSPETTTTAAEQPVSTPAPEPAGSASLQPPSKPIEPTHDHDGGSKFEERDPREVPEETRRGYQRDKIATSLNIAKLQAMQMSDLNKMAKDLAVENFGTMRKHEVI